MTGRHRPAADWSARVWVESVADAPSCDQVDRRIRLELDLAPEPADVDIDRARVTVVMYSPYAIEQLPTRIGSPAMGREHRQ